MAHHIEITQMDHQIPHLDQTSVNEIEEGRKVDHLIEIREINGEDRSGMTTNKPANQIIDEIFADIKDSSSKCCTIFKVCVGLNESNPDAYKPKVISIGSYHKHNPELRFMEKYKLRYLQRFLCRKVGIDVESCIRELEDEALKCYDDIENLDSDIVAKFSKILLLDGCFLIEFIRESCEMCPEGEGWIIPGGCLDNQIRRDLLLLENQLPFFVLTKLHHMTKDEEDKIPFTKMVKKTFLPCFPKMTPASFNESEGNAAEIKHLLQVLHMSCHPSVIKTTSLTNPSMETEHSWKSLCCNPLQIIRSNDKPIDKDHLTGHNVMPNATEFSESGVSFIKVGYINDYLEKENRGDNTSLFDIKFENGLLKIPSFRVTDETETLLRNLIAYEQQSSHVCPRYFSDFTIFMDYLIDSDKDVSLLSRKGIGEDKEIATLFNKIGKAVNISSDFHYKEECRKLVHHCEQPRNLMKASLRHNYFNTPWVGASTLAAVVLLILTAMQTVLAFTGGV
ncbi:UPF0481 protein At3g47200-like [Nicotiana tomentosiformis]|uniref:UPF0481 protein At3g47200-like n=1 Tax=Nicotiana tomentosiformis TaxID=4098 RepID=UPI00051BDCE0|nr:putative UPF0481 protein At3g02645 [Nicotiana tomentosiformis]XP_033512961.1 putative UPF0481 protein At3g02645 [Nicotiana tomentosiformis]